MTKLTACCVCREPSWLGAKAARPLLESIQGTPPCIEKNMLYNTYISFERNTRLVVKTVGMFGSLDLYCLTIHISLVWTQYKVGLSREKRQVSTPSHGAKNDEHCHPPPSFCPPFSYSLQQRRYPHLFLDDEAAAAIIPPATRPTTPKAPVMIAMPIIPSLLVFSSTSLCKVMACLQSCWISKHLSKSCRLLV